MNAKLAAAEELLAGVVEVTPDGRLIASENPDLRGLGVPRPRESADRRPTKYYLLATNDVGAQLEPRSNRISRRPIFATVIAPNTAAIPSRPCPSIGSHIRCETGTLKR